MATDYPAMATMAMATMAVVLEAAMATMAAAVEAAMAAAAEGAPRESASFAAVREGVIMSPRSIPPESITVWEAENVNGVVEQVKQTMLLQEIGCVALIATVSSITTMVMGNVENVAVAANATTVEEMVTNRNPSIIALPQKFPK